MTNEKILLRLINACIDYGYAEGGERKKIVVQLSPTYLPQNILTKAQAVLEKMQPDEGVLHDVPKPPADCGLTESQDLLFSTTSPWSDPESLPGGLIPPPKEFARYPDGVILEGGEKVKGDPGDGG